MFKPRNIFIRMVVNINIKRLIILLFLFTIQVEAFSQKTLAYTEIENKIKSGIELFNKKEYASAQKVFYDIIKTYPEENSDIKTDAEFFIAVCAIELFNKDADYLITSFIHSHPESPRLNLAKFYMAKLQYREKHYKKAIKWFEKVDKYQLNTEELAEYYFKYGYSLFIAGNIKDAETMFGEIKDANTRYSLAAKYYFAHIQYEKGNYKTALDEFKQLEKEDNFKSFVPYYIVQIYYKLGEYNKVKTYGIELLKQPNIVKKEEITRLVADAFFRTEDYENAAAYLERYIETQENPQRTDLFELAYSLFKTKKYNDAAKYFEKISPQKDSLYQNTNYLLAKCYLEKGDKHKALNAFSLSSKYDFYPDIKRESAFNYAKLSYELDFNPFDEVINSFLNYINTYPNAKNIDEAYDYLARALYQTKNYQGALNALEKIKKVREDIKEIYQRATFFRGIELFKDGDYANAIIMFNNSINNSPIKSSTTDKYLKAEALFWRGEAYYRLKRYDEAIESFKKFIYTPGAYEQKEYKLAHYNLGYAYFKKKNYKEATKWFRKFVSFYNTDPQKTQLIADALTRIGDCFFMQRKFDYALEYYKKAIDINKGTIDYTLYQAGICYGLLGKYNEKIITLARLINDYENSPYLDDALYEQGNAFMQTQEFDMAEVDFQRIINDYPKSKYVPDAYMNLGLIYYKKGEKEKSKEIYQTVVEKYKGTKYFNEALQLLKTLYIDEGNVEQYKDFLTHKGLNNYLTTTEEDSLTYIAAEKFYMENNCNKAIEKLKDYLLKFPDGKFAANANFYLAECYLKQQKEDIALEYYKKVAKLPTSKFTEIALSKASTIAYKQQNWEDAHNLFKHLYEVAGNAQNVKKALFGMAKAAYKLKKYEEAQKLAKQILSTIDQLLPEQKLYLHYLIAKSLYEQEKYDQAIDEFTLLSNKPETKFGAEAFYRIAEIYFKQGKYDKTETTVFNFVKTNTPQAYWLGKAFLLLADVYVKQNNLAQAQATLQSIIDNYNNDNDGIKDEAKEKLKQLQQQQNQQLNNGEKKEEFNIDYSNDKIFEQYQDTIKQDTLNNN